MFGALKPGFRSLDTLKLVVILSANFKIKGTAAASRGFFATAWLFCLLYCINRESHTCKINYADLNGEDETQKLQRKLTVHKMVSMRETVNLLRQGDARE